VRRDGLLGPPAKCLDLFHHVSAVFFLRQHRRGTVPGDSDEAVNAGFEVEGDGKWCLAKGR
jgi:hypothetical protein